MDETMERFMDEALALAREAAGDGETPVGCVVVKDGRVIGRGRNRREARRDVTAHAELEAIRDAERTLGDWRLSGCTLYVTLEPCPMCMGGILQSRVSRVVFGAFDPAAGCCGSVLALQMERFSPVPAAFGGVREQECRLLLADFFARRR